jgi:hypothetical protein
VRELGWWWSNQLPTGALLSKAGRRVRDWNPNNSWALRWAPTHGRVRFDSLRLITRGRLCRLKTLLM